MPRYRSSKHIRRFSSANGCSTRQRTELSLQFRFFCDDERGCPLLLVDVRTVLEDGRLVPVEHLVFVDAVVILGGGGCPVLALPPLRYLADGGIDTLAAGDDDAVLPKLPFHFFEERIVPSFHHKHLPQPADRRLVGDVGVGGDAEEHLVRGTVVDVLFRLRIAESEELLQERDAEENVHVERPTAPLGWVEFRMPLLREREIDVLIFASVSQNQLTESCKIRLVFLQRFLHFLKFMAKVKRLEPLGSPELCAYWSKCRIVLDAQVLVELSEPISNSTASQKWIHLNSQKSSSG